MNNILLLSALLATATTATAMPELSYENNTMVFTHIDPEPGYEPSVLQLRCGFYDESDPDYLILFVCVGELYEYVGGAFYSDDLFDTRFVEVILPWDKLDAPVAIDGNEIMLGFYDMISDSWPVIADEGTVTVSKIDEHVYDVEFQAADHEQGNAIGGHICRTDAWRWRDFNEERPNPNQFELKKNGYVINQHDILSCVVDESDAELPVFYLADQQGLTSVDEVLALENDQYVMIQMPLELMDGMIKGFSGWSDDSMTVTYKGIGYNHSGCMNDELCYGGNVQVAYWDHDTGTIEINSMIFAMVEEDYCNMNLHYEGAFVINGNSDEAISNIQAEPTNGQCFDLMGRLTRPASHSFMIRDGKKLWHY